MYGDCCIAFDSPMFPYYGNMTNIVYVRKTNL